MASGILMFEAGGRADEYWPLVISYLKQGNAVIDNVSYVTAARHDTWAKHQLITVEVPGDSLDSLLESALGSATVEYRAACLKKFSNYFGAPNHYSWLGKYTENDRATQLLPTVQQECADKYREHVASRLEAAVTTLRTITKGLASIHLE